MNHTPDHNLGPTAEQGAGPAQALRSARVLDRTGLPHNETAYELEGGAYGQIGASVIIVDAPPGGGPRLHKHPYVEIFVLLEGRATFTAGEDVIDAIGGQIVIVPAGVPHKFVNSGTGPLRQVDIHPSGRFSTE